MPNLAVGALQLHLFKQVCLVCRHLIDWLINPVLHNFAHFSITSFNLLLLKLLINLLVQHLVRESDDSPPEQLF